MEESLKQLLLKDLCARLPYGVKIDREWIAPMSGSPEHSIMELDTFDIEVIKTSIEIGEEGNCTSGKMNGLTICDDGKCHFVREYMCKPYLRPMSSMTEEEKTKFHNFKYWIGKGDVEHCTINMVDWLNTYHFDYRGLIEKGLALEAPEGMYKTESI